MEVQQRLERLTRPSFFGGVLLLALVCTYGTTLDVPFYFDDIASISDNQAVHDVTDFGAIAGYSTARFVGYLSFAVNYSIHSTDVTGYHLVNLVIHLLACLVIFGLVLELRYAPRLRASALTIDYRWLAVMTALAFAVHPLNTQAVTYIVQRLASLSALFYLLACWLYLRWRVHGQRWHELGTLAVAVVLGLFTKQSFITLPVSLWLMDVLLLSESVAARRRAFALAAGCLVLLALGLAAALATDLLDWRTLDFGLTRDDLAYSRLEYFLSQLIVVWRYIGLFFWPSPLVLDYDVSPVWKPTDAAVVVAAAAHLAVFGVAAYLRNRNPLASFAILFYYVTLSIESSIIPIRDPMVEHRTYLPNVALCLLVSYLLLRYLPTRIVLPAFLLIVMAMSALTYQRNAQWRDPVQFYTLAIEAAPAQPRNWYALTNAHYRAGDAGTALKVLETELEANEARHGTLSVEPPILVLWAQLLRATEQLAKAQMVENYIASTQQGTAAEQRMLLNRGNGLLQAGDLPGAAQVYQQLLAINPGHETAQVNLGVIEMLKGNLDEAAGIFERYPSHPVARQNLETIAAARRGELVIEGLNERVIRKRNDG